MDHKVLQDIGLSQTEAKVYLALLEINTGSASEISRRSAVNRTNVYDALEKLMTKGLVTYLMQSKRTVYQAGNPKRLKDMLRDKEKLLNSIMDELSVRYSSKGEKEGVVFYESKKGIISLLKEMISENPESIDILDGTGRIAMTVAAYFSQWNKRRESQGIKARFLHHAGNVPHLGIEKSRYSEVRLLPDSVSYPSSIILSKNIIGKIIWFKPPFALQIMKSDLVQDYNNFFKNLWESSKRISKD